MECQENNS